MPMLAHPIDKVSNIDWDNAFAQPKLDGHRSPVNGMLYSRQGKPIHLPHIHEALGDYNLLNWGLDGELYVHGLMLQEIGSLIKKPREDSKQVQLYVYDRMADLPFAERYAQLQERFAGMSDDVPLKLVPTFQVSSMDGLDKLHADHLEQGYEGTILRQGLAHYEDGKRSSSLLKVKDFTDTEFKVIGFKTGTPNGSYQVPIWVCENPSGADFDVTAQGPREEKHAQWERARSFIGRMLTVKHFGYSKGGVPLLPVALRWREDI